MRLTDMTVQKLSAPESGSKVYSDDSLPSFAVRVRNTGTKTFILTLGTEQKHITLGRYGVVTLAQAREKVRKIPAERELGIEPKTSPTFKDVLHEYLDRRAAEVRASTRQADSYHFKLCEGLDRRRIDEIGPKDIQAVIDKAGAPSTKRSAYIRLSGFFSYAVRIGYLGSVEVQRELMMAAAR